MIYTKHKDYIKAISRWKQTPATITKEGMFVNGIPYKEWITHNPKPVYEVPLSPNPDGTKIQTGIISKK
jgi:hypothetical protein